MPRKVPTSAAATFSPTGSMGLAMDATVMAMPSTAHEHSSGRHQNQCAAGCSGDDNELRQVQQRKRMPAGHDEAADHRTKNNEGADNDNHESTRPDSPNTSGSCRRKRALMERM